MNALVHRDYLVSAPIRLFIYDNRIEIINPGHLPNNLTVSSLKGSPKSSSKTEDRILELIRQNPYTTTEAMGEILGITKRAVLKQANKLKAQHRLRRVGPARGGHWEVIE